MTPPMTTLTQPEIKTLMDGLDTLVEKANAQKMLVALTVKGLELPCEECPDHANHEKTLAEHRTKLKSMDGEFNALRENVTLLRAKLITMRREMDSNDADRILNEVQERR